MIPMSPEITRFLRENYILSESQIASFRQNGHLLLRGVATSSVISFVRPLIRKALQEFVAKQDNQGRVDDYSALFTQVTNVWRTDEQIRAFIVAQRFARIAAELMGVPGVRLYHDQALFKPASGKATPWHRDSFYWPLDTEHTVTMWMPLVDCPKEMGPMQFASGSHKHNFEKEGPISHATNSYFENEIAERRFSIASYELQAGDATFHSGRTLHSSLPNLTDNVREVITVIYYADGTRLLEPSNEYHLADMQVFHPGQKAGERAASPLNPLLLP